MEESCNRSDVAASAQPPADWYKPCSDEHLADISLLIADWRAVSPFLGLTEAEEIAILESTHSVPARKMAMLRKWKQKKGRAATYDQLSRVFKKCELVDLEEKMKQILEDSSIVAGPSPNPSTQDDPLITTYASYLKEMYSSKSHSHTSQHWSHLPRCEFIQLAMIKDEEIRRGEPEEEMIRLAQQGKIETIMSHKESIDLYNLFPLPVRQPLVVLPPPPPGRVCLIEGAPGVGKSTFALHICHQWTQGASWLERFDIVVLVYLRDEAVQNANTLADILLGHDIGMSQSVASQIQATGGQNVLLIFDGWDEFPSTLMVKSLVSTIIRNPQKLSLHRSTVFITSRPVASGNLFQIADRRVEILGFTQHQIREYIKKALDGNTTHIQTLTQHLEDHPVIEGYCYVPLHAAILVHLFLTMKKALPTTLHELFCSLILCCIVREHDTHEPKASLPDLSSLDDLPLHLKSKLNYLGILAYNGIMKNKIVFNSKDLKAVHLPTDLPSLGLLQAVEGLALYNKSISYNFLHLSVQELLAAYHISKMDSCEQVKVFQDLFQNRSRFQAVLHYYCGFTKLENPTIQGYITSYQADSKYIGFTRDIMPLLHCFFEAQNPFLCKLIDSQFIHSKNNTYCVCICTRELVPIDYLAIGYFIASVLSTFNELNVHLSVEKIDDYCLKLLLSQLSKYPLDHVGCQDMVKSGKFQLNLYTPIGNVSELIAAFLKKSPILDLFQFCNHRNLIQESSFIFVYSPEIREVLDHDGDGTRIKADSDALLHITEALQTNTSVSHLNFCCTNLQHTAQINSALTKMLNVNKTLTHLNLSDNKDFSDSGAHCIFKCLQRNTTLVVLDLSNTGIKAVEPDIAKTLGTMIQVNKSLTHLYLSGNKVSSEFASCTLFESLQHNSTLENLSLWTTDATKSSSALSKMLQLNRSLTQLCFSYSRLSIYDIIQSLQHNTKLVELYLSNTGIETADPDTARSITTLLHENKLLTHLDLSRNSLSDSCILEGLQHNTTLVELNLNDTGISVRCISPVLRHNTTLLRLFLRGIVITDSDAKLFGQALKLNDSLKILDIVRAGSLSDIGIYAILVSLKGATKLKELYLSSSLQQTIDRYACNGVYRLRAEKDPRLPDFETSTTIVEDWEKEHDIEHEKILNLKFGSDEAQQQQTEGPMLWSLYDRDEW